tara:strand:+ start:446 stop:865 length:420 start_codon:yes stop_codon:yes gene_type:complete
MATTTAAVTLTSDLLSDNMSVVSSTTCMKAGTTADGLTQMDMGYIEVVSGTNFDLLDAENDLLVNKANKVLIANESTDETYYTIVTVDATVVGRLYAGDWMFIPWSAEDATADIEVRAYGGTNKLSYVLFHEGRTLTSA